MLAIIALPAQASNDALTASDVNSWLDGMMGYAINAADIAGGVVVVVKDGEILTERGYGYRDVAARLPLEPQSTLIRPGSISKLFTWTAVMQLVERGQLDLDSDVNRYLDFQIPPLADRPVTLRNIMTHTAGFEESLKDLGSKGPLLPLADYLRSHLPRRIYPPGDTPAYSNYATALAGYIIARVAKQPFEEYIEQQILRPLGMAHSSFRQPLPESLASALSKGYRVATEPPQYFEYINASPAGSLSCTADDMARFMIAHLHAGRYAEARILQPETARLMHTVQPKIYPALNGMALGFYETSRNGHQVIAHNGGTQFFHSDLHLFVDDDVGIFISLNSAGTADAASRIHDALFHGFADRYFPTPTAGPPVPGPPTPGPTESPVSAQTAAEHARLMSGAWENSRRSASTFMSLADLLSPMMIAANADGTITVPVPGHGDMAWRETSSFVWQQVGGVERMQAIVVDGRPTKLGFGMAPPAAFLPVPVYRSPTWLVPALGAALAVLLANGLLWPSRKIPVTRIVSIAAALVMLAFPLTLVYMAADIARFSAASDVWVLSIEAAAFIVFPFATVIGCFNVRSAWTERRGWRGRLGSILVLASSGVLLWVAIAFHLMNFDTRY